jgi:hypothetical protein
MTGYIRKYLLLPVFISLVLSGCFSPWKGDEATLTLLLSDGHGSRGAAPRGTLHTVVLDGPTGKQTIKDVEQQLSVKVAPGYWNISIKAYLNGKFFAEGKGGLQVKAGQNNQIKITMELLTDIIIDLPSNETDIEWDADIEKTDGRIINIYFFSSGNPDPDKYAEKFTVTVKGSQNYSQIEWLIMGATISKGESVTILARDYPQGVYKLVVMAFKNGVPYSDEITFKVN